MSMLLDPNFWQGRLKAAGWHLVISLVVAGLAALLVFFVWYPYPHRVLSGGRELFLLVVAVDLVMGPLMTLAVFNIKKPVGELRRDLVVIGLLRLTALAYGLWTVSAARPVHLVFEFDRFRVVHAVDVDRTQLAGAIPGLRQLPLMGPTVLSVRNFTDNKESFDSTIAALQGFELGANPDFWQSYDKAKAQVIAKARPLAELKIRFPSHVADIDAALHAAPANAPVGYIPLHSRSAFWTVLVNTNTAEVLGFVPLDPY